MSESVAVVSNAGPLMVLAKLNLLLQRNHPPS